MFIDKNRSKQTRRLFFVFLIVFLSVVLTPLSESLDIPSQVPSTDKGPDDKGPEGKGPEDKGPENPTRGRDSLPDSVPSSIRESSSSDTVDQPSTKDDPSKSQSTDQSERPDNLPESEEIKTPSLVESPTDDGDQESGEDTSPINPQETADYEQDTAQDTAQEINDLKETAESGSSRSSSVSSSDSSSEPDPAQRRILPVQAENKSQRPIAVDVTSNRDSKGEQSRERLTITVDIPEETSINRVTYKSNHPAVEALLKREKLIEERRYDEETRFTRDIEIPSFAPAGNHTIEAFIETVDENGFRSIQPVNVTAQVSQEKGVRGIIQRAIPRLSTDAYTEIISRVSPREQRFVPPLENTTEITTRQSVQESHTPDDITILRTEADPRVQKTADDLEQKENLHINKTIESYETTDEDGIQTTVSRIVLSIRAPQSMKNISIVEVIPKEIAEDVSELELYGPVEIVQEDPIVRWNFDYAQQDEEIKIGYSVTGSVDANQTKTLGGAESVSGDARFISFLINGGWFIIVVGAVLLLVVLPTSAYVYKKKRRLHSYTQ